MKKIILLLIMVFLLQCDKEYSCENCGGDPVDTAIVIVDTIPSDIVVTPGLKTSYNIYIPDNKEVKKIYLTVKDRITPGHYHIYDSIKLGVSGDSLYFGHHYLDDYYTMSNYIRGDTFYVKYVIRWRFNPAQDINQQILVY